MEEGHRIRSAGSLCTRSRAAPDWNLQELLTLANEINAIENECRDSLSSFQKWKLIVQNCNALEVNRSLNQCRSKWNSLLDEYRKIMKWESEPAALGSYWSLDDDTRKEWGLPECFHNDLFDAVDNYMKAQIDEMRTDEDTDTDPEAVNFEAIAKTGTKKRRHRMVSVGHGEEEELKPQVHKVSGKIKQFRSEEKVDPTFRTDERMLQEENVIQEREQMMATKLRKHVELINAILEENLVEDADCKLADMKNEMTQVDFSRNQCDKLIDRLANLADTLNHLCDFVQECG